MLLIICYSVFLSFFFFVSFQPSLGYCRLCLLFIVLLLDSFFLVPLFVYSPWPSCAFLSLPSALSHHTCNLLANHSGLFFQFTLSIFNYFTPSLIPRWFLLLCHHFISSMYLVNFCSCPFFVSSWQFCKFLLINLSLNIKISGFPWNYRHLMEHEIWAFERLAVAIPYMFCIYWEYDAG